MSFPGTRICLLLLWSALVLFTGPGLLAQDNGGDGPKDDGLDIFVDEGGFVTEDSFSDVNSPDGIFADDFGSADPQAATVEAGDLSEPTPSATGLPEKPSEPLPEGTLWTPDGQASDAAPEGATSGGTAFDSASLPLVSYPPYTYMPNVSHGSSQLVTTVPSADSSAAANPTSDFVSNFEFVFHKPARFPLREFDFNGQLMETEGAIIYEGMRFAVDHKGRYRVRFKISTPAMPVTLRLQFKVNTLEGPRTITLEPISIPEKNRPQTTNQQIVVSPVYASEHTILREGRLSPSVAIGVNGVAARRGTARFGFGVDVP